MMIATGANAVLGFVFWIIVARFYPAEDVGLASAAIAATGLLALFSYLGLGAGLIRFLPGSGKDASSMINTAFTVGVLASLLAISIFVAGLGFWSPSLLFLRQDPLYLGVFYLFSIIFTLSYLVDNALIARRRANYVLVRSLVFGILRLILPVILVVFFDFFGIFSSWGISMVVAFLLCILLFLPRAQPGYRPSFTFNRKVLSDMLNFSAANYVTSLFWSAPVMVLPIMVVNLLGAELNAYFYIAWSVSSVLAMVPTAASTSLFTEGSHEEKNLRPNIWRSLKMVFVILVPLVILVLVLADRLLLLFGSGYSENATALLRILTASTLPLAINLIYLGIIRVEKKLKTLIGLSIFAAVVTLVLSYVLLPRMGINGAGIAWLVSQSTITLWIVAGWLKGRTSSVSVSQ
jgi:O-antigen/teichoic acid export membrane protein